MDVSLKPKLFLVRLQSAPCLRVRLLDDGAVGAFGRDSLQVSLSTPVHQCVSVSGQLWAWHQILGGNHQPQRDDGGEAHRAAPVEEHNVRWSESSYKEPPANLRQPPPQSYPPLCPHTINHMSPPHPPPDNLQNVLQHPASAANYSRRCQPHGKKTPPNPNRNGEEGCRRGSPPATFLLPLGHAASH